MGRRQFPQISHRRNRRPRAWSASPPPRRPPTSPITGKSPPPNRWSAPSTAKRRSPRCRSSTPATSAAAPNVKLQDGCNNRCAFCIIPSVRGPSRSADAANAVRQVRALAADYPEVVLTGINLGALGARPRRPPALPRPAAPPARRNARAQAAHQLRRADGLDRGIDRAHRPIPAHRPPRPHAAAVGRRRRAQENAPALPRAPLRAAPAGRPRSPARRRHRRRRDGRLPGETDADFAQTRDFIARLPFTYLHVFPFSPRSGTEAAAHAGQVPAAVKKERSRILRETIAGKNLAFRRRFLGRELSAVSLPPRNGRGRALSDNFIPLELDAPDLPPAACCKRASIRSTPRAP